MQKRPPGFEIREGAHQVCLAMCAFLCWGSGEPENLLLMMQSWWELTSGFCKAGGIVLGWGANTFLMAEHRSSWGGLLSEMAAAAPESHPSQCPVPFSQTRVTMCTCVTLLVWSQTCTSAACAYLKVFLNIYILIYKWKKPQSFWLAAEFAPFREAGDTSCVKWWNGSKVICWFLYWCNQKKLCLGSEQIVGCTVVEWQSLRCSGIWHFCSLDFLV